jgi:predicted permease
MLSAVSHAWHSWTNARAVAALAIVAFAVGIGSATAIYTVVNAVMLRPLPYANADRFVALYGARFSEPGQRSSHVFPDLIEYQQRTRSFDVFGWFRPASFTLTYGGQPRHVVGTLVTPSLAQHLGVDPVVGQWFTDDQGVVISNSLWRQLGSPADIVGQGLTLDGRSYTVAGVMPPAFRLPVPGPGVEGVKSDVWIALDPMGKGENRGLGLFFCYARLGPGVTLAQAEDDVRRAATEIASLDPASHPSYTARLDRLRDSVLLTIRPTLLLLMVSSAALLVITCADVAGLLLARSVARARETAIRVALGARQRQLALQYFLEGVLVALAGAAAGVALSGALVRAVVAIAADYIPRADEISLDWTVVAFTAGCALAASALASLAPLWQAVRTQPADTLNAGIRATATAGSRVLARSLVVAEIALAFALVASSAILAAHLGRLGRLSPGFDADDVLTFQITRPDTSKTTAARAEDHKRFTAALEGIAGVTSAALVNSIPMSGCCLSTTLYPEGATEKPGAVERVSLRAVSPGYFATLQIPLRAGRLLDERDRSEDALRVVVNEAAVRTYWPERNPVGAFGHIGDPRGTRFEVVGVVGDVRNDGLGKPVVPEVHIASALVGVNPMRFLVRSSLPAETLVPAVRRALEAVDPALPMHDVTRLRDVVRQSLSLERVSSIMLVFFALAALLMAALAIYGVVSYDVRQSTVELGTRMALGATARDLLFMVVGGGLKMAALGAAIGAGAVAASAWLLMRAFDIPGIGALPLVTSTAIVAVVSMSASFFPGWRATRLSPMVAIRNEPGSMWQSTRQTLEQVLTGLTSAVSARDDRPAAADSNVLTDLVTAARSATSFPEAFDRALTMLSGRLDASWMALLERGGDSVRAIVAVPPSAPDVTVPAHGFLASRLASYSYPLPFDADDLDSWSRWAAEKNERHVDEIRMLRDASARMAVPLRARGELLGLLLLGPRANGASYRDIDRGLLRQCAEPLTLMLENARLTSRVVEQEKLRRDVALAAEVQRRLLPERAPEREGSALAGLSLPARSVGGDYYDFLELGDHRIGIALADIAGKGVAAALLMAVVQASLRIVASEGQASLPDLAARMNSLLHRSTGANGYATFFYAELDECSRQLRYVNAGHNPPYLLRTAGEAAAPEIRELSIGGTVLGLFPQMAYEEATVDLKSGDVLVAFTDGVTEALNVAEEEFGEERLKTLLRHVVHLPAAEISSRIAEALHGWIKDTAQYDDLTFVVMKVD